MARAHARAVGTPTTCMVGLRVAAVAPGELGGRGGDLGVGEGVDDSYYYRGGVLSNTD
jgi:hypothetical protein